MKVAFLVFLVACIPLSAYSQTTDTSQPLRGVQVFYFAVSDFSKDMTDMGFDHDDIEAITAKSLQASGVRLLSSVDDLSNQTNSAILLLKVQGAKYGSANGWPLIFHLQFLMLEPATTVRDPKHTDWVVTWMDDGRLSWAPPPSVELPQLTGSNAFIFAIKNYVVQFVIWWKYANQ